MLEWNAVELTLGYKLFLTWYPVLGLVSMGWNSAMALFQADQDFLLMFKVRMVAVGGFNLLLLANLIQGIFSLQELLIGHLVFNLIASLWCAIKGWDGLKYAKMYDRLQAKELINFGKYAMGTLIGSSLLKSADTFIIGLSLVMGESAIALYAIPLKLTDVVGIPLVLP